VSRLFVTLQYLLPHHLLCRLMYMLTRLRLRPVKDALIGVFCRLYRPDMSDALEPDPRRYESFNAFFTRALRPDARPPDPDLTRVLSPCDGTLSIADTLSDGRLLQAKGHWYTDQSLLAAPPEAGVPWRDGRYATIYLAPYNYHRLHMPLSGRLTMAWHVPGRVFSVNARTVARVPRLFSRNERVVCLFEGEQGPFVLVLVGALFVGSISTVWHGDITPWRGPKRSASDPPGIHQLRLASGADTWLARGAEFARFNMGSTVVMLLPSTLATWDAALAPGMALVVGRALGTLT
jgi:phosphatidylserine decarboxylase